MRMLSVREVEFVSGGRGDVVVTAKKLPSPEFLDHLYSFMKSLSDDDADGDGGSGGGGGEEMVSNNFNAEWASMMGPGLAPSERAEYFAKWFEKASASDLKILKGVVDTFLKTLVDLKVPVLNQLIGHLGGMSNNLRDAANGSAPRSGCGWSFGIDVSNAYADAPNALMSYAGWKAIMNLWPSPSPGNI